MEKKRVKHKMHLYCSRPLESHREPTRQLHLSTNRIRRRVGYHNYLKYSHTITHTCAKFNMSIWLPVYVPENWWMKGIQCRPWSDAAFCGVWSGSTLFALTCLPQYTDLIGTYCYGDRWFFLRVESITISTATPPLLQGMGTLGRFSAILYKGVIFCEFLFAFMHT